LVEVNVYLHWFAFGFCTRFSAKVGDQEIKCTHFYYKLSSKSNNARVKLKKSDTKQMEHGIYIGNSKDSFHMREVQK
jgi:hypothetical protein